MRIYEFSKQSGIPSKELLDILSKEGYHFNSHMSVLPDEALQFLQKKFTPKAISPETSHKDTEHKKMHDERQEASKNATTIPARMQPESAPMSKENNQKQTEKPAVVSSARPMTAPVAAMPSPSTPIKPQAKFVPEESPKKIAPLVVAPMSVGVFASVAEKLVTDVIVTLLKWGIVASKNHLLSEDIVQRLAHHYEIPLAPKTKEVVEQPLATAQAEQKDGANMGVRLPVVAVLGHVDHGKTTLLDFIRKTRVAAREKGGITQHLGAYEAHTPQGNIIFIDTPGHEAFSKMRMRGIKVADLVILVVAADDSVMPQTIEAIKQAKAMHVPIIVAVNKIDKVDATRLEVVRRDLAAQDLLPEEWGGETVCVPISAKTGKGIDQLLEMIILQSQMMDLKADLKGLGSGYVLEAKLEKGRGPVATILSQHGIIKVGDFFVCGNTSGKITSLVDSHGSRIKEVGPSIPVLVAGFEVLPNPGDYFTIVPPHEYKKAIKERLVEQKSMATAYAADGINIMVKTDTNSSKEALLGSLHKVGKKFDKKMNIVYAGIGNISESDVELASATSSTLYAFHVKTEPSAHTLAQKLGVSILLYDIIYKLLEDLEARFEGAKEVKKIKTKIGEAIVRQVFDIKGLGVIAGCYVSDGRFSKDGSVVVLRGNRKIGDGKIKSLQREKKPVKEVHMGFECGFLVDGFNNFAIDDRVECYLEVPESTK